jgi:DNA gyrase/topoisomerase IV subunit A
MVMNMDISMKDLEEMNIVDIHDKMVDRMDPRNCRLLYDFIEGNLNKENINEWAKLQVNLIVNLKVLLKVANKKNIDKTIQIIENSNSKEEAVKKLSDEYGHIPEMCKYIIEMPRENLLEVHKKEDEYKQLLKRREVVYSFLFHLTKICDLID